MSINEGEKEEIWKKCLQVCRKAVPLQRVFHGIRFKVNKGWSTAVLLFFCPYPQMPLIRLWPI